MLWIIYIGCGWDVMFVFYQSRLPNFFHQSILSFLVLKGKANYGAIFVQKVKINYCRIYFYYMSNVITMYFLINNIDFEWHHILNKFLLFDQASRHNYDVEVQHPWKKNLVKCWNSIFIHCSIWSTAFLDFPWLGRHDTFLLHVFYRKFLTIENSKPW